jgi:hypothetical protein
MIRRRRFSSLEGLWLLTLLASGCGPAVIAGLASAGGGGGGGGSNGAAGVSAPSIILDADPMKKDCLLTTDALGDEPDLRNVLAIQVKVTRDQTGIANALVVAKATGGGGLPVSFVPVDPGNSEQGLANTDASGIANFEFRATAPPTSAPTYELEFDVYSDTTKLAANEPIVQGRLTTKVVRSIVVTGSAIFVDENQNHSIDAGDRVIVALNQKVVIDPPDPPADDALLLSLPSSDSFGGGATLGPGPASNAGNDQTKLTVNLGTNPKLETRGATSGVDLRVPNQEITTLDGCPASIASKLGGTDTDIVPFFWDSGQKLGVTATTPAAFPTEDGSIGDIDRDGYPDYLAANAGGTSTPVYRNLGAANPGFFDAKPWQTLSTNSSAFASKLGDLDRDGWLDAVIGVSGNAGARDEVFRFDPTSMTFVSAGKLNGTNDETGRDGGSSQSRFTHAIALVDINCDGALDIVTGGNYSTSSSAAEEWGLITWLNNGGAGAALDFTLGQHLALVTEGRVNQVYDLAAGDLNGDGYPDLLLGRSPPGVEDGSCHIYFFDPAYLTDPTRNAYVLAPAVLLPQLSRTKAAGIADFDGDGLNDLVLLGSAIDGPPTVFLNDKTAPGSFPNSLATVLGIQSNFHSLTLTDFDGDGDVDIIAGRGINPGANQVSRVFVNDGFGTFHTIDKDGNRTSLINAIDFLPSTQNGSDPNVTTNDSGYMGAADLDLDGDADVIQGVFGRDGALDKADRVYLNSLSGTWGDPTFSVVDPGLSTKSTNALALGDFNRDGRLDLAVGNKGGNQLKLNQGGKSFSDAGGASFDFGNGADTRALVAADLNCNGKLDLVEGNFDTSSIVYFDFDENAGVFAASLDLGNSTVKTDAIAVIDYNRDGRPDLILGNRGFKNIAFRNDGLDALGFTKFVRDTAFDFGDSTANLTRALAVGDFDRNGFLDILEGTEGDNFVWLNDVTNFKKGQVFSKPNFTFSLTVADLNKDGILDYVAGNGGEDQVWLGLGDVTGGFKVGPKFDNTKVQTNAVVLADIEADGDLDLVCGNELGPTEIYLNDGAAGFTLKFTLSTSSDTTRALVAGDLDRDGDVDFFEGRFNKPNVILENQ